MNSQYHEGELAVQAQVGVQEEASQVGKGIRSFFSPAARLFLEQQPMVIVGFTNPSGVWTSLLSGHKGFMEPFDEKTLEIAALPLAEDPLHDNLSREFRVGLLAIDFAMRRRLRVNGSAKLNGSTLLVTAHQVYANCPKYIQARDVTETEAQHAAPKVKHDAVLSAVQSQWIGKADTFFISTFHPEQGGDASHRGGYPGFVRVVDETQLEFPDYSGNSMFNTLGNIIVQPAAGLLFIDFEKGSTLQLSGRADIVWDVEDTDAFAGAERIVRFEVQRVVEIENATPLRWRFLDYSPFNP